MNLYTQPMLREDALKDKVAIVTGGEAVWKSDDQIFSSAGRKSSDYLKKFEKLKEQQKNWKTKPRKVLCVACDVRNWDEVEAIEAAQRIRKN
jgi:NADP-dependent 3-hydroxy acid dehydrogenase YdfG